MPGAAPLRIAAPPGLLDDSGRIEFDLPLDPPSLDGLDSLDFDPEPSPEPRGSKARKKLTTPKAGPPGTAAQQKRIAAELEAYTLLFAAPIIIKDPICGPVIEKQAGELAGRIAKILSRYPDLAAKFATGGVLADWLALAHTVWPIASVIRDHHITHTVGAEEPENDQANDAAGGLNARNYPAYTPALARP